MFDYPQVLAQEMVTTLDHPVVGKYRGLAGPIKFSATPGPDPFASPALGQHTVAILEDEGYSVEDIAQMKADGSVISF
jgi:formyl-CoA transferase